MRRLAAEGVEGRQRGWLRCTPQHVGSRTLARVPHVLEGRCAQQLCDQLQLQANEYVIDFITWYIFDWGEEGGSSARPLLSG